MWGGQSCPGVPSGDGFEPARRLKGGGSQEWLPHSGLIWE